MARNEYESVQVVCFGGPIANITLNVTVPPSVEVLVHAAAYYTATNLSDCNGRVGRHADPLIPDVDPYVGEKRNAFPLTVPSQESRVMWVDVWVPPGFPAGDSTAAIAVMSPSLPGGVLVLPIVLRVWDITLPDTSPLTTIFGYDPVPNVTTTTPEALAITYADMGLMHRVTLPNAPYLSDAYLQGNWPAFAQTWRSFWRGRQLPFGLKNSTMTSLQLPAETCWNWTACTPAQQAQQIAFWANMSQFFRSESAFELLYDYTTDEPEYQHTWTQLIERGNAVHQADPQLRVLCTLNMDQAVQHGVQDIVDLWVPIINEMEPKYDCDMAAPNGNNRASYDNVSVSNLLWYQSCSSHGCGGGCYADSTCSSGWPSYMIDHPPVYRRIMAWLSYVYNLGGELYWSISYAAAAGVDEWETQYLFGGNGDGTMTYRGTPDHIGGTTEIPIASIRMKHVRDGQEDIMLMQAAEAVAGRAAVLALVQSVAYNTYTFSDDATLMLAVRDGLAALASGSAKESAVSAY